MKRLLCLSCVLIIVTCGYYGIKQEEFIAQSQEVKTVIYDEFSSNYAILLNEKSGEVLFEKNAKDRIYPASLTKIMTVYLALQHLNNEQELMIIPSDIFSRLYEENASMAGFLPGEKVAMIDVIYGAFLSSGAEACEALAIHISGSEEAFVKLMNKEAKRIGMNDTQYKNCTGLDEKGQYSSVYDISLLLREALKSDAFVNVFQTTSYEISSTNMHPDGFMITSTMRKTMEEQGYHDASILGGKTGYTPLAGLCLASQGEIYGKSYLFVSGNAMGMELGEANHILDAMKVYGQLRDQR